MVRLTRILCPVDLSETSRHALDQAIALARRYKARLTVLEVSWAGLPPIAYPGSATMATTPLLLAHQVEELRDELRLFAERGTAAGVKMDLLIREGAVVPMILEEARTIRPDLIVIGTHGRSGFDRLLLGSVTEKVLRKAECAVMTVPPADRTATPAPAARTIVCTVDFSPASLKALDFALSLAQELPATLLPVATVTRGPVGLLVHVDHAVSSSEATEVVHQAVRAFFIAAIRHVDTNDSHSASIVSRDVPKARWTSATNCAESA